jgi:ABC-type uncharacterized transport system permease subunit
MTLRSTALRASITILVFFALAAILLVCFNPRNAHSSLIAFFSGPFRNPYSLGNMLSSATALCFSGLGAALAFRAGIVNLGGEGYIYLGALSGYLAASATGGGASAFAIMIAACCAFGVAAVIGSIPSLMKRGPGWDELITSFLLAQALIPLIDWIVAAPLRDPGSQIVATALLPATMRLPRLLPPSSLDASAFIALALCAIVYLALRRSYWGFKQRTAGQSPEYAKAIGLNLGALRAQALALSSGIMGVGGFFAMLGGHGRLIRSFPAGMGWSGLACAIVAGSDPILIPFAALLFAYLDAGTTQAQFTAGIPPELSGIIQAIVFFMAASTGVFLKRRRARA